MENNETFSNIDEYIALFPPELQARMQTLRLAIKEEAPRAEERISWRMPTFFLQGNLVHFAAFSKHIGFYPGDSGVNNFQDKLTEFKTSKGAIQFPHNKPLPLELVRDIVRFRVAENCRIAEERQNKKK